MATPRPYGRGPYGVGPYERFAGNLYECAGRSSLTWATKAPMRRVAGRIGGRTGIAFELQARVQKTVEAEARSSVVFDSLALGMTMIIGVQATAEIVFTAWAPGVLSWEGHAPCWPGGWLDADSCAAGAWTPPGAGGTGTWVSTGDSVPAGVWTPVAGCNAGVWNVVRN